MLAPIKLERSNGCNSKWKINNLWIQNNKTSTFEAATQKKHTQNQLGQMSFKKKKCPFKEQLNKKGNQLNFTK